MHHQHSNQGINTVANAGTRPTTNIILVCNTKIIINMKKRINLPGQVLIAMMRDQLEYSISVSISAGDQSIEACYSTIYYNCSEEL